MGKKLSIFDAGFLMMETRETPMHIGMLQLYGLPEGAPDDYLEQIYRRMVDVEGICRPFNQKLHSRVPGRVDASWITDENFDIDYHVRHSALPRPGRVRELLALVSRLHAQRLDPRRPLWECYLIEGLEGNRFAVYNKMHHAMMDGAGGMNLLQSRMSTNPGDSLPPPWSSEWNTRLPRKRKKKKPAPVGLIKSLRNVQRGTSQFVDLMRQPKESNIKTIYQAPKTVFNHRVTGARRFAAQSWSLDRIKKVAEQHDGTVNDIFLAMCGGAMRRYLLSLDKLPHDPLVAQVPVALRSMEEAGEGGNAITTVQVSLGTHLHEPTERLEAIKDSMNGVKGRLKSMEKAEIDIFTMISNLPLSVGQMTGISGRMNPLFNLVISNVPGPKEPLYMGDAKMLASYPVSLVMHGYALNITVFSYCDSLEFGIIACRETLPRIQRMLDYLEESLVELEG